MTEIMKAFDIKDGCGIHDKMSAREPEGLAHSWPTANGDHEPQVHDIMPAHDLIPIIITARESKIVENRCKELGIKHCYQGCRNKSEKLDEIVKELNLSKYENGIYTEIAYMGDDIVDLPIMKKCKIKGCPSDAADEVKEIADFISSKKGGNGAAREFIEWLINIKT